MFENWVGEEPLPEARVYRQRFPSAYITNAPENDQVHLSVFVPNRGGPVPVVVLLHYWGASDLRAERAQALRLARVGIGTVILELPYHLSRAPKGTRSGELAVVPDVDRLKSTMVQSVWDVRRAVDWIETRKEFEGQSIGLAGTSLGGIVGALAFSVEPRFTSFCSMLGGADLAEILWSSSRLVRERDRLRRQGYNRERLREALAVIEPKNYRRPEDVRPTFVIAAKYDTIVPRPAHEALIRALDKPEVLWLQTGHYGGFFVQGSLMGVATDFFAKTLRGEAFTAPKRLYAPTLRITASANAGSGLQVGLGLDFWRNNDNASLFGTAMLTPKGLEAFVGTEISTGLNLGLSVQRRRTVPALLWSFVL